MSIATILLAELDQEAQTTKRVLERMPQDRLSWRPHPKSMSLMQLGLHVAELPNWATAAIAQDQLDAATAPRPPATVKDVQELLARFDRHAADLRRAAQRFDPASWNQDWAMRQGSQVMVSKPRPIVYRTWCLNHMIHHRGQLCVYLRLLNVPVPTVYFNSADDPKWVFE